ncbi:efflux RND transporter permease subunit [Chromatocurvus halotolerans]|uniref:SSD domain-containing protein n=1 Tax=Chromatocurvus halotolerans TaxID=1132028 RepID=A0A4R2L1X2_9GAMM|nr:MMPL family transporter [Chromatocurvus halotolerans]TCO77869.1 hypothetical protein EV688_102329 [Chromatocurvus halotolerans]
MKTSTIRGRFGGFMSGRYRECLDYPVLILLIFLGLVVLAFMHVDGFRFDASEDTLVAEGDPDLIYYREVSGQFGGEGFLVMTYMPRNQELLSDAVLGDLDRLVTRLERVEGVKSVDSILDAPLLQSPPLSLSELATNYRTLQSQDVDYAMAKKELTNSPVFKDLLISDDGSATALRITLETDSELQAARHERDRLQSIAEPGASQRQQLEQAEARYREAQENSLVQRDNLLAEVRAIRDDLGDDVVAHLGGVPMIAADMVDYVKQDVMTFGALVLLLVTIMLFILFRRIRWVVVPLASTGVSVFLTIGVLGYLRQPTTVVSSNFISLLVIITISFSIHLISRYRELRSEHPGDRHVDLVFRTMMDKLAPCFYTALTTVVAFASLITSDIVPVMDFGWIMSVGIVISFLVSYSFFAAVLLLLPKGESSPTLHHEPALTRWLSGIAVTRAPVLLAVMLFLFLFAAAGINRLSLENRFVDYFRADTEIHEGLAFIDRHLGGTVPMDIILRFDPFEGQDLDESSDFFTDEVDDYPERYWFTPAKIEYLEELHGFLEAQRAVGKVLSLYNLELIARDFNDGRPLGAVELVAALDAMPEHLRSELIAPYAMPESGRLRVAVRLHEADVDYQLDTLIRDIEAFATTEMGLSQNRVRVTGMAVLFNGMLKHLFNSQTSTLMFVVIATLLMFLVLLRSVRLALLGLLPNLLAAATALGIMGFAGIPLDIMTITIAAIIIGIGVDDAIHYLHRFREEYARTGNAKAAVQNSHASIGNAIYYTSITVVIGFSVLGFSNFMPTVYFGLMTALAMVLALLANLALLPSLLVLVYQRRDSCNARALHNTTLDRQAGSS